LFWPDHCVQGTHGAAFHPAFDHRLVQAIFRKGSDPLVDSYSVFQDNAGRNPTGLDGWLRARGAGAIYLAGLALDYCVRYTARDARLLMPDLPVLVVEDACRPVDPSTGREAVDELRRLGVGFVPSGEILNS
jgi:nicotinamidase/pyrazinamidase